MVWTSQIYLDCILDLKIKKNTKIICKIYSDFLYIFRLPGSFDFVGDFRFLELSVFLISDFLLLFDLLGDVDESAVDFLLTASFGFLTAEFSSELLVFIFFSLLASTNL